jgi:hypothetical protein
MVSFFLSCLTFLTQTTYGNSRLLSAHNKIWMMFSHDFITFFDVFLEKKVLVNTSYVLFLIVVVVVVVVIFVMNVNNSSSSSSSDLRYECDCEH